MTRSATTRARILAFALCAFAIAVAARAARAESLQLVAPAHGAVLRGGSFAELRWTATELPPSAEEWEAFLSINGGEYYAYRITPHLELELRSFTFIVPNVDTRDARILIRVGDEVHPETHFETAVTFSIVHDKRVEPVLPRLTFFGRGESARDGDPSVIAWTDGSRAGTGLAERCTPLPPAPAGFRASHHIAGEEPAVVISAQNILQGAEEESSLGAPSATHRRQQAFTRLPLAVDLLLVCRRRNI